MGCASSCRTILPRSSRKALQYADVDKLNCEVCSGDIVKASTVSKSESKTSYSSYLPPVTVRFESGDAVTLDRLPSDARISTVISQLRKVRPSLPSTSYQILDGTHALIAQDLVTSASYTVAVVQRRCVSFSDKVDCTVPMLPSNPADGRALLDDASDERSSRDSPSSSPFGGRLMCVRGAFLLNPVPPRKEAARTRGGCYQDGHRLEDEHGPVAADGPDGELSESTSTAASSAPSRDSREGDDEKEVSSEKEEKDESTDQIMPAVTVSFISGETVTLDRLPLNARISTLLVHLREARQQRASYQLVEGTTVLAGDDLVLSSNYTAAVLMKSVSFSEAEVTPFLADSGDSN